MGIKKKPAIGLIKNELAPNTRPNPKYINFPLANQISKKFRQPKNKVTIMGSGRISRVKNMLYGKSKYNPEDNRAVCTSRCLLTMAKMNTADTNVVKTEVILPQYSSGF